MQNLWPMRLFLHKSTPDTDSDVLHGYESVKRCCVVEGLWSVCRFNSSSLQAGRHPEGKKWAAMLFISDPVQQNDQHTEWNVWEKIIQRESHWWLQCLYPSHHLQPPVWLMPAGLLMFDYSLRECQKFGWLNGGQDKPGALNLVYQFICDY